MGGKLCSPACLAFLCTRHSRIHHQTSTLPFLCLLCSGRRGLEVLQACAQLLMREIGTESLASGLEVTVQVGGGWGCGVCVGGGGGGGGGGGDWQRGCCCARGLVWFTTPRASCSRHMYARSHPQPARSLGVTPPLPSPPLPLPCPSTCRAASSRSTPLSRRWRARGCRSARCACGRCCCWVVGGREGRGRSWHETARVPEVGGGAATAAAVRRRQWSASAQNQPSPSPLPLFGPGAGV